MRHELPVASLGASGPAMAKAVDACVHCGFCLSACPTYDLLGLEADSPRGRIVLMKEVLEGSLALEEAMPHVDGCLGCLACVSACPSGVAYGELLTPFRSLAEERRRRGPLERMWRFALLQTLPYPERFRIALLAASAARPLRRLLGARIGSVLGLVPRRLPRREPPAPAGAHGARRARVALLVGCAQQVVAPGVVAATVRVLERNGVEVTVPAGQGCCGALSAHAGAMVAAKRFARRTMAAFGVDGDVDALVTTAAGCGSGVHEYPSWFAGEAEEGRARALAERSIDVSAFLHELGPVEVPALEGEVEVAYQDACHLAHAQGVRDAPRELLAAIPGVRVVELDDDGCCGSAGTYNLEQPLLAGELGRRKAAAVLATGAAVVASGNVGCLTQLAAHLAAARAEVAVLHTIEVLDRAYRGVPLRG